MPIEGGAKVEEMKADIVVVGGGMGGCATALAACRNGMNVILTEETDWIGGQVSQQGVPPDEHKWIESGGATASYRMYRNKIRDFYRYHYHLTEAARNNPYLNPGNGGVNPDMSTWIYNNGYPMMSLMFRLMRMGLSVEKSTKPYTQEAYLNDIEKQLFKETLNGKPLSAPMIAQLSVYISSLKGMCPTLKAIDKAVSTKITSIALNEQTNHKLQALGLLTTLAPISATEKQSGMEPMTSVNFYSGTDIEAICYDKLKSARRYLIQARSLASNDIERGKCDYLIAMIDRVI